MVELFPDNFEFASFFASFFRVFFFAPFFCVFFCVFFRIFFIYLFFKVWPYIPGVSLETPTTVVGRLKSKAAWNEKPKNLHGFSYTIIRYSKKDFAGAFHWAQLLWSKSTQMSTFKLQHFIKWITRLFWLFPHYSISQNMLEIHSKESCN